MAINNNLRVTGLNKHKETGNKEQAANHNRAAASLKLRVDKVAISSNNSNATTIINTAIRTGITIQTKGREKHNSQISATSETRIYICRLQ